MLRGMKPSICCRCWAVAKAAEIFYKIKELFYCEVCYKRSTAKPEDWPTPVENGL